MNKISLESAFNSYFHNKYTFSNFCNINIDLQYKEVFYSKNTFSPSKELKQYQKFLNYFIFDFLEINDDVVYSYRKDVNASDALKPHVNKKYIYTTDVKSFFLNIDIDIVKEIILNNKENSLILSTEIEKYIDLIINLITFKNILPIGAPTSPKISNAYLYNFDNNILKYCNECGITYTRYSDDFIFSSNDKDTLLTLPKIINTEFEKQFDKKLKVNEQKSKIHHQGSKIIILGLLITPQGTITINKKIKNDIETLLYLYITNREKFSDFFSKKYDGNIDKVSGVLSYIYSVDLTYINKLKTKYGNYIVNSFIHRSIESDKF